MEVTGILSFPPSKEKSLKRKHEVKKRKRKKESWKSRLVGKVPNPKPPPPPPARQNNTLANLK